ncbi:SIMPL domain-containing protein [Stutzerimonas kirkiae]|uniref:SIMPL domain-containing protein n=1 Tax=Stutzerimonas kirkiae TaxID=2211392 RepID=A0A4Q9RCP1_9GAMM|nr:SIMPL domain-containing protein [Stutzerimonas kirkiae]TBU98133.1 hypothetical protein DNJ96_06825 [Stutzerimonas kirkiae]TBV02352.1 hypothetical protein DNJ95_09605 [Stutzerimonas kirkiae]TBV11185.1 hypothetical protein DNK08_04445 [Stutzerimonas kirkiae]TBV14663.1 hypothetical protein DNK01_08885 [Stutzerimonas kirkiae]
MAQRDRIAALILGAFLCLGLVILGQQLGSAAIRFKEYDRSVTVKGLSEHEYPADIVIWPIQFTVTSNDLEDLYNRIEQDSAKIGAFLLARGILASEITPAIPDISDRSAQRYSSSDGAEFRYIAVQSLTLYSSRIDEVRSVMNGLMELGKQGITFGSGDYQARPQYLFTRLNEVKPKMIEEATRQAREVAQKFAEDSASKLGKIRKASQGQFSIDDRDANNPHIKQVRVVSTVEYYLSD